MPNLGLECTFKPYSSFLLHGQPIAFPPARVLIMTTEVNDVRVYGARGSVSQILVSGGHVEKELVAPPTKTARMKWHRALRMKGLLFQDLAYFCMAQCLGHGWASCMCLSDLA